MLRHVSLTFISETAGYWSGKEVVETGLYLMMLSHLSVPHNGCYICIQAATMQTWTVFIARRGNANAVLGVVILSNRPCVICLSVHHTRFATKIKNILPIFWYHIFADYVACKWRHSSVVTLIIKQGSPFSFLKPTVVARWRPLIPKMYA